MCFNSHHDILSGKNDYNAPFRSAVAQWLRFWVTRQKTGFQAPVLSSCHLNKALTPLSTRNAVSYLTLCFDSLPNKLAYTNKEFHRAVMYMQQIKASSLFIFFVDC